MKTAFMLILKFYHKIKLNSALLAGVFFIAQLSLLFLSNTLADTVSIQRAYHRIPGIEHSIYYYEAGSMYDPDAAIKKLPDFTADQNIKYLFQCYAAGSAEMGGEELPVFVMNEELVSSVCTLDYDASESTRAVLSGKLRESPKKGNEIQLTVRNKSGSHRLDVSIAEILSQEDAYLPYFHIGGSGISIYNIFQQIDGVILLDNGTLTERLGLTETELYPNGILVFDAQAEGGQAAVFDALQENGYFYKTYEAILKDSEKITQENLSSALPLPLLALTLSFLLSVSLTVLFIHMKSRTFMIYYILGLSKIKSYFLIWGAIGLLCFIPLAVNLVIVCCSACSALDFIVLFLYFLMISAIALLSAALFYRRKSIIALKTKEAEL